MTDPYPSPITASPSPVSGQAAWPSSNDEPVRLYGPWFQQNPAEVYRQMRQRYGPVAPVLLEGDLPAWFVLGYREVFQVTSDSDLFARDSRRWHSWDKVPANWSLLPFVGYQPSMMFTEGAEHQRRAGAVSDALDAVDRFELHALSQRIADELIDGFSSAGTADLMAQYAHPMPSRVIATLFGFDDNQASDMAASLVVAVNGGDGAVEAHRRVGLSMHELLKQKHERPGSDVPSRLIAHPAGLTDDELAQDMVVVLAAAQQPTAYWIGNTIRLMLTDTRFAVTLSGGRRSVGQALTEVLWEDTPTQNFIGRWATRNTQLGGQRIQTGDMLILGLAAANTDPQLHPGSRPGAAGNRAHMSFGHGEHGCPYPGPELAEVITKSALEVLLDRLPDLTLTVAPGELTWCESVWMHGLTALPVEFTPV